MVGGYLADVFDPAGLYLTDSDVLDITDREAVRSLITKVRPDTVIHLAAETNVDKCELDPDHAFRINTIGTLNVVLAAREVNAKMIYMSTGAVFNGDKGQEKTEFDTPAPASVYAKSKYEGENLVGQLAGDHLIVRTGWVVGGGTGDHKFVGNILDQLEESRELLAVDDKWGCLTYAPDLLRRIKELIDLDYLGLWHVVNEGAATRYEIVEEIVSNLGLSDVLVKRVSSDCFDLPAPRPESEMIANYKMRLAGLAPMRSWQDALRDYLTVMETAGRLAR